MDEALGPGAGRLEPSLLPVVRGRPGEHLLQRGRPPRRGRPRTAAGADPRQPGHRHGGRALLRRSPGADRAARRRPRKPGRTARRPGADLHADDPGGRGRDAGLRADRCRPLGGVRRLRRPGNSPPGSTTRSPGSCWRRPAASRSRGSSSTSRCSTKPSPCHPTSRARPCCFSGRSTAPRSAPPTTTGGRPSRPRSWPTASRSKPPIRCTSSTRRVRRACPRASCATTEVTSSRSTGACATSTAWRPARSTGRRRTSAGSWATPTSSTRR